MPTTRVPLDVVFDEEDASCATTCVRVLIEDASVSFVLDSGARRSQVLDDIAGDWPVVGVESSNTVFSEHLDRRVAAPALRLGDLRIEGLEMSRVSSTGAGARNLLGLDVFRHHSCLLDLARQTLALGEQPDFMSFTEVMPLYLDEVGHAYLDVVVGSELVSAVWDTGGRITVVDTALLARRPALFEEVEPTVGIDAVGQTQQIPIYLMGPVSIAGVVFEEQKVAVIDLSAANATWFIDFPRRQWALSRPTRWRVGSARGRPPSDHQP